MESKRYAYLSLRGFEMGWGMGLARVEDDDPGSGGIGGSSRVGACSVILSRVVKPASRSGYEEGIELGRWIDGLQGLCVPIYFPLAWVNNRSKRRMIWLPRVRDLMGGYHREIISSEQYREYAHRWSSLLVELLDCEMYIEFEVWS